MATCRVEDLWPGDVIRTVDGRRRVIEIRPLDATYELLVVAEPRGAWLPSIGEVTTALLPCALDDQVVRLVE